MMAFLSVAIRPQHSVQRLRFLLTGSLGFCSFLCSLNLFAADGVPFEPLSPKVKFVPQNLLKLIHAPEVQKELELDGVRQKALLAELAKIDGPWWRARIKPEDEQRKIIADQEALLLASLKKMLPDEKMKRLRQIELQSQGSRMFARPDVAASINLTPSQAAQLDERYAATDAAAAKLQGPKAQDKTLIAELQSARDAEIKLIGETLTDKQKAAFNKLIGTPFDTVKLSRIFPLAPELIDTGHWAGASATQLADHRGSVVLLHFYAFQCHNCVANFEHYKRWHEKLTSKGVRVIGIQTPETSAERDVKQVQKAAKDKGFTFPVLIDTDSSNWNAWANTMWPTVYVIDKNGYVRFWWQGELNWEGATGDKTIESLVDKLLLE
jgi:peroxiredoxin